MTGLIGWWPLHETSGDTAHDLSGNENHGYTGGGLRKQVAGRQGLTSYRFNGEDSYVGIPDNSKLNPDYLTVGCWFYLDNNEEGQQLARKYQTDEKAWALSTQDRDSSGLANLRARINTSGGEEAIWSDGLEAKAWYHVMVTYDGDTMILYLDGRQVASNSDVSGPINNSSRDIYIGADTSNDSDPGAVRSPYTEGKICDLRYYNRALSPSEVRELYHQGSEDLHKKSLSDGSDVGAVSRWKLDDDGADGSTAVDSWSDNEGSIEGASFTDDSVRNDGRALEFDGEENYVRSNDVADGLTAVSTDSSNPFTVVMWAKLNSDVGDYAQLASFDSSETDEWFSFGMRNGSWDFYSDGRTPEAGDVAPTKDAWVQVVMEWDGEYLRLYENTEQVFKQNPDGDGTWIEDLDRFVFGAREINGDLSQHWLGVIDNISIFDRVLESWEVFELYRWGSLGKDMRKELVNKKGGG